MEKLKTGFLNVLKKIANVVSITALILTVLSGVMVAFYDQISEAFITLGWSQERLTWMTLALGGLGTAGVITTHVSRGLKTAVLISRTESEKAQVAFEKEVRVKIAGIEKAYDQRIALMEQDYQNCSQLLEQEFAVYREEIEHQRIFDRAQAIKYVNAPDNLVNKEAKEAYREYLEATEV